MASASRTVAVAPGAPSPSLSISPAQTPDGPGIVLAWPAALAGAVVEATGDLATPTWVLLPAIPVVQDGQNTVTVPSPAAASYFRLKLP